MVILSHSAYGPAGERRIAATQTRIVAPRRSSAMIRAKKGTPHVAGALRRRLRSIAAAMSVLLASAVMAHAQAPAAPPPGMTQEQFDSLVDAISNSVTEKLKAEGVPAGPAGSPAGSPAAQPKAGKGAPAVKPKIVITAIEDEPDEFGLFFERAKGVAQALPILGTQLAVIPGLLDQRSSGGRGTWAFVLLLGLVAVVAVAAEAMLRRILGTLRTRLAAGAAPGQGMRSLIHLVS